MQIQRKRKEPKVEEVEEDEYFHNQSASELSSEEYLYETETETETSQQGTPSNSEAEQPRVSDSSSGTDVEHPPDAPARRSRRGTMDDERTYLEGQIGALTYEPYHKDESSHEGIYEDEPDVTSKGSNLYSDVAAWETYHFAKPTLIMEDYALAPQRNRGGDENYMIATKTDDLELYALHQAEQGDEEDFAVYMLANLAKGKRSADGLAGDEPRYGLAVADLSEEEDVYMMANKQSATYMLYDGTSEEEERDLVYHVAKGGIDGNPGIVLAGRENDTYALAPGEPEGESLYLSAQPRSRQLRKARRANEDTYALAGSEARSAASSEEESEDAYMLASRAGDTDKEGNYALAPPAGQRRKKGAKGSAWRTPVRTFSQRMRSRRSTAQVDPVYQMISQLDDISEGSTYMGAVSESSSRYGLARPRGGNSAASTDSLGSVELDLFEPRDSVMRGGPRNKRGKKGRGKRGKGSDGHEANRQQDYDVFHSSGSSQDESGSYDGSDGTTGSGGGYRLAPRDGGEDIFAGFEEDQPYSLYKTVNKGARSEAHARARKRAARSQQVKEEGEYNMGFAAALTSDPGIPSSSSSPSSSDEGDFAAMRSSVLASPRGSFGTGSGSDSASSNPTRPRRPSQPRRRSSMLPPDAILEILEEAEYEAEPMPRRVPSAHQSMSGSVPSPGVRWSGVPLHPRLRANEAEVVDPHRKTEGGSKDEASADPASGHSLLSADLLQDPNDESALDPEYLDVSSEEKEDSAPTDIFKAVAGNDFGGDTASLHSVASATSDTMFTIDDDGFQVASAGETAADMKTITASTFREMLAELNADEGELDSGDGGYVDMSSSETEGEPVGVEGDDLAKGLEIGTASRERVSADTGEVDSPVDADGAAATLHDKPKAPQTGKRARSKKPGRMEKVQVQNQDQEQEQDKTGLLAVSWNLADAILPLEREDIEDEPPVDNGYLPVDADEMPAELSPAEPSELADNGYLPVDADEMLAGLSPTEPSEAVESTVTAEGFQKVDTNHSPFRTMKADNFKELLNQLAKEQAEDDVAQQAAADRRALIMAGLADESTIADDGVSKETVAAPRASVLESGDNAGAAAGEESEFTAGRTGRSGERLDEEPELLLGFEGLEDGYFGKDADFQAPAGRSEEYLAVCSSSGEEDELTGVVDL